MMPVRCSSRCLDREASRGEGRDTSRIRSLLRRDRVFRGGMVLPPRELRLGGPSFADDDRFLKTAQDEARRLVTSLGLTSGSRVLDVGCGVGRLAIGILSEVGDVREYWGVDVDERAIQWCRQYVERDHPRFRFVHLDVGNPRYNPSGQALMPGFRFPFPDQAFEIIYLYSVFSHMLEGDARLYLAEFHRLLVPSGRLFLTAFAEDAVPPVTINPPGYRRPWSGPLHCVRYETGFLRSMVSESGLTIDRTEYATETDGQTAFYALKKS